MENEEKLRRRKLRSRFKRRRIPRLLHIGRDRSLMREDRRIERRIKLELKIMKESLGEHRGQLRLLLRVTKRISF